MKKRVGVATKKENQKDSKNKVIYWTIALVLLIIAVSLIFIFNNKKLTGKEISDLLNNGNIQVSDAGEIPIVINTSINNEFVDIVDFVDFLNDSSPYRNNGVCATCPAFNSSGKLNGSLIFDGITDYVDLGNPAYLNPIDKITVSVWIYPTAYSDNSPNIKGIVSKFQSAGSNGMSITLGQPGNKNKIYSGFEIGGIYRSVNSGIVSLNMWHNVVTTYNGSQLNLYLDGALAGSKNASGNLKYVDDYLYIGNDFGLNIDRAFKGNMDEVAIWNRSLIGSEISDLYNLGNGKEVNDSNNGLVGLYHMNAINKSFVRSEKINECYNINISGTFLLDHNSIGCIFVNADNVVIDGNGYNLSADIFSVSDGFDGIYAVNSNNLTIRNLGVLGFSYGIYIYNSSGSTLSSVLVKDNYQEGIYFDSTENNNISSVTAIKNGYSGFRFESSNNNQLFNIIANDNGYNGIWFDDGYGNTITSINANNNGWDGIYFYGNGNTLSSIITNDNGYDGIEFGGVNNTLSSIITNGNGYDGIIFEGDGHIFSSINANNNGDEGIDFDGNNNILSSINANNNIEDGIDFYGDNNILSSINANNNSDDGIIFDGNNNTLSGIIANNNIDDDGIEFYGDRNTLSSIITNGNGYVGIIFYGNYNTLVNIKTNFNIGNGIYFDGYGNDGGSGNYIENVQVYCNGYEPSSKENWGDTGIGLELAFNSIIKNVEINSYNGWGGFYLYNSINNTFSNMYIGNMGNLADPYYYAYNNGTDEVEYALEPIGFSLYDAIENNFDYVTIENNNGTGLIIWDDGDPHLGFLNITINNTFNNLKVQNNAYGDVVKFYNESTANNVLNFGSGYQGAHASINCDSLWSEYNLTGNLYSLNPPAVVDSNSKRGGGGGGGGGGGAPRLVNNTEHQNRSLGEPRNQSSVNLTGSNNESINLPPEENLSSLSKLKWIVIYALGIGIIAVLVLVTVWLIRSRKKEKEMENLGSAIQSSPKGF